MNKFEFITHLLDNQKMNSVQKERFLKLASKEIGLVKPSNEELWEEIKKIKRNLGDNDDIDWNNESIDDLMMDPEIRDDTKPFDLSGLLGEEAYNEMMADKDKDEIGNEGSIKPTDNENSTGILGKASSNGSEIRYATYKNLPFFLRSLNANDYTKFLTHSVDSADVSKLKNLLDCENYNFEIHLKKIKEVFDVLTKKDSHYKEFFPELRSYYLSRGIYTKIRQYIYGPTWSLEKNIKMHWSHPKIQEWTNENYGKAPSANEESMGYEGFYFHSSSFKKQMSFSDLILYFKNEIHIRSTNSLYGLINDIYNNPDNSLRTSIDIENNVSDNLDFYTDVEKLRSAIKLILELIVERHSLNNKPRVIFNISIGDEIILSILHFGNTFRQSKDTLRYGKSFCNLITLLNGICEIDLFAKFSDSKSYHLKLWEFGDILKDSNIYRNDKPLDLKEKLKPNKEEIDGVQYNLTFNRGL